jgi:pSer/pThr/pTyr-binding forkhead associated (FHA) protein
MNMFLQLKDLASQKLITVPEEGMTFGREGGDAQIQVADMGVSKRHAEVFCEQGAWFLKDLGSSNGTMLSNERIGDATEILPGDVFQLSKRKFEVLKVVEDDSGLESEEEQDDPQLAEPERKSPAKPAPKAAARSAPPPAKKPAAQKLAPAGASREPTRAGPESGGDDEVAGASPAQIMAGALKAVPYYLANVPLMLLNPVGTIRKGIEEQPRDPMGRLELIAWALPGTLFAGAVAFIATFIAAIIGGSLGGIAGSIMVLVLGAVAGVVGAVVMGLVWHPLTEFFVVKVFKGECDARSRTNFFLQFITVIILTQIPNGLSIVLTALIARVGLPFLLIIPIVIGAVATALVFFLQYKWYESFNVARWVKIVMLVLMALSALSTLARIPTVLSAGAGRGASTPGTSSGSSGDSDLEIPDGLDEGTKAALEAGKNGLEQMRAAGAPAESIKAAEDALRTSLEAARKSAEQLKGGPKDVKKPTTEDVKTPTTEDAKKPTTEDVKKPTTEDVKKPEVKSNDKPLPEETKEDPRPVARAAEPETPKAPPPPVPSGGGYPAWRAKFDSIEKRVTDDPTVLRKSEVLKAYQALQEKSADADAKVRKDKKLDARTQAHLRDAELYESSGKTVDTLYKALFSK